MSFRGSGVALVTPFNARGVNERVLGELIDFQLREGTDAIVVCGSTGEAATMSAAEQRRTIAAAAEAVGGRVPLVAGVGGSDTAAVAELARAARAAGADLLLVSGPPYNKPTQAGLLAHFRALLESADLPMIVYNVPGRTACNILPETIEALAEDPRVVGVKEASGDIAQIGELCRRVAGRLAVYSGNDDQVVPILALGGVGVISVLGNIAPRDTARMVDAFLEGRVAEARDLQLRYLPLIRLLFREPNPVPVKVGVRRLGFEVGSVRLPLMPLTEETAHELEKAMRAVGIGAEVAA